MRSQRTMMKASPPKNVIPVGSSFLKTETLNKRSCQYWQPATTLKIPQHRGNHLNTVHLFLYPAWSPNSANPRANPRANPDRQGRHPPRSVRGLHWAGSPSLQLGLTKGSYLFVSPLVRTRMYLGLPWDVAVPRGPNSSSIDNGIDECRCWRKTPWRTWIKSKQWWKLEELSAIQLAPWKIVSTNVKITTDNATNLMWLHIRAGGK